jgi:redox-sensitive bicupin YhaK (pirin superfamily)
LAYVHLVRGQLRVNGHGLSAGDALLMRDESQVQMDAGHDAEVLVFDLSE